MEQLVSAVDIRSAIVHDMFEKFGDLLDGVPQLEEAVSGLLSQVQDIEASILKLEPELWRAYHESRSKDLACWKKNQAVVSTRKMRAASKKGKISPSKGSSTSIVEDAESMSGADSVAGGGEGESLHVSDDERDEEAAVEEQAEGWNKEQLVKEETADAGGSAR